VSGAGGQGRNEGIDELYTVVLKAALNGPNIDTTGREDIQQVLFTVICAREPLTIGTLLGLLGLHGVDQVHAALRPLWSVLQVDESSELVATLHASFPDYMLDHQRSQEYHCDSKKHNHMLALRCFDRIKEAQPQFNICELESSYVPDEQVPNLRERVEKVSAELFCACRYWSDYLECSDGLAELVERLEDFLSARLLLWMEVMNLKGCMDIGTSMIQQAEAWAMVSGSCSISITRRLTRV
jgi:hypothetical protein